MRKIAQRLLIFCVAIPYFVGVVFLLPHFHHLAFNLNVIFFSALGAMEFAVLLAQKGIIVSKIEAAILGSLPAVVMILIINFNMSDLLIPALGSGVVIWFLISRIFSRKALDTFINRIVGGFAVLLYPGMLMAWQVPLSRWENSASALIVLFLAIVFCGDGAAWAAGMLLGKGNQGIIPASPNKSIAGFIGGIIVSILLGGLAAAFWWPDIFILKDNLFAGIPRGAGAFIAGSILGLVTGIIAILGDLAESALKRSSGLKDSGSFIPGRGGVLDCIDSMSVAAPVFYLMLSLFFVLS